MDDLADHEGVIAFTVLMLLLFLGPLAYYLGVDSRTDDRRR